METIYLHHFGDKEGIAENFGIDLEVLKDAHIFLAYYHCGDWGCDSSAYVLFEKDGELFEVHGGHCSCHGLEGQWEPEKISVEYLVDRRDRHGNSKDPILFYSGGYDFEVEKSAIACRKVINFLEERVL